MQSKLKYAMENFFATCPKGLESLLITELAGLGAEACRETVAGVYFDATLETVYKVCLWTRLANRILCPISQIDLTSADELYRFTKSITWQNKFEGDKTFVIDFIGTNDIIRNSQYGAQLVKDGIVDHFKDRTGERPSVSKDQPDVRINVRLAKKRAYFSLDYSGESLHRRGYRKSQGVAPLKENLAAAILLRAGWPDIAKGGGMLIDPMCGSGTFLVEGALMALNIAPGVYRKQFGFENLRNFDASVWNDIKKEAEVHKKWAIEKCDTEFRGYDASRKVLDAAEANIGLAGLSRCAKVMAKPLAEFKKPTHQPYEKGLMICNPPYGERLGEIDALKRDYQTLGRVAKGELPGWTLGVFTANAELGKELRLRSKKTYKLFNGSLPSQLQLFDLVGGEQVLRKDNDELDYDAPLSEGAQMVYNRITKNQKRLSKWLKKEAISSYRIYDADMPEYAAAIDVYGDYIHIQEYQAPKTVNENKAQKRFQEIVRAVTKYFDVSEREIAIKVRKRNKGKSQYEKLFATNAIPPFEVQEGQAHFLINLNDYLDSGLFLDHRPLRKTIAQTARGKTFLNLFCYTASATVHAALGGAESSVSVDMSNTYLEWAKNNFSRNNISLQKHQLVREDCFKWLEACRQGFDMIMLDPPSFSNSKKMDDVLDVQRDHVKLIQRCMDILNPGGVLYFSTNLRSFKMDSEALDKFNIKDISTATLDPDFKQNPKIHYCWEITVVGK